MVKQTQRRLQN